jgi:MscS family membrane protein
VRLLALLMLVFLTGAAARPAVAAPATTGRDTAAVENPLAPLDTSSPRATIASFRATIDRIYANIVAEENTPALWAANRRLIQQALTCLDISALPASLADSEGRQALVCLKEVLDRIPLPPAESIPDAAAAKADGLKRWRLPGTEIALTRIGEGPREGDYVFSAETVSRAEQFYELVRLLPYRADAGSPGLHEAYVTLGGWMIPESFIRNLPAFAHTKLLGETIWQWIATLVLSAAAAAVAWQAWRLSRRLATGHASHKVVGRLLFPAVLIAVSLACDNLLTFQIRLTGDNLLAAKLGLRFATLAGVIAGVLVGIAWLCDLLINLQGMRPEGIDSQLIRLGGKVLTFVAVAWILLNAADSIGLPVTPLMAGLGAGGLAVALASQYTLENLIAGLVIFADKPVRIGDDCQFGSVRGHVERIGLRSTRIRGADRSVISVPNAEFAKMQLVNYTQRDHIPLSLTLTLEPDIPPRQLRQLLERLHRVLIDHPRLANEPASARLASATPGAITVEVSAVALTGDDDDHLAIREEVLLAMLDVIRSAGRSAEPAAPARTIRAAA